MIRNILCNPQSSLDFREAIDTGKILLFNLSDGILGEANSQLLGQLIVSKFQTAVMSRADTAKDMRQPFYLYVDEFQTFTGTAYRLLRKDTIQGQEVPAWYDTGASADASDPPGPSPGDIRQCLDQS